MTASIVCLGWGSLIWEPASLESAGVMPGIVEQGGSWHVDGPDLPLELARNAVVRDPPRHLLSWVITPGAAASPTLWARLSSADVGDAVRALAEREGIAATEVGRWPSTAPQDSVRDEIGAWAKRQGHAAVVWTAQSPEWLGHARAPALQEALAFLASLVERGEADHAERYVRKTPPQTRSQFRSAIEQRFGWIPS